MSIDVAAMLLEKGFRLSRSVEDLLVSSSRHFAEGRDFYRRLAGGARGPVVLLEPGARGFGADISALRPDALVVRADRGLDRRSSGEPGWCGDLGSEGGAGLVLAAFGVYERIWGGEGRRALLRSVWLALRPGGKFVFDARFWGGKPKSFLDGAPRLALEKRSPDGLSTLVWEAWRSAGEGQKSVELSLGVEVVGVGGLVESKAYSNLLLARVDAVETALWAVKEGFEVESCHGDFSGGGFTPDADLQVWVLVKRGGDYP